MKTMHKLRQSTSNFKNHFVRDSKVMVAGTLFMFMLFGVVVNVSAASYKIIYDDNVTSNMPEDVKDTTMNNSVNISGGTPKRDGYKFLKWCTQIPNSDGTCSGAEYAPGTSLTISGVSKNEYSLYAMWGAMSFDEAYADASKTQTGSYFKLQDMSSGICSAVSTGQTGQLIDVRDNTIYNVAKLADNNCWFLDNMALDLASVTLANLQGNTNASNTALGYLKNGGGSGQYASAAVADVSISFLGWNLPFINTTSKNVVPSGAMSGSKGSNKVGVYYNYCAATAGSYCYAEGSSTGDATEDICPAGWRMPTGASSGEYQALYAAYDSDVTSFKTALSTPLSGYFVANSTGQQGSYGHFWSSKYLSSDAVYDIYVASDRVSPVNGIQRRDGISVRCVAQ